MRYTYLARQTLDGVYAWARQLIDDLNREPRLADLSVFADDAAAAAANVPVNGHYVSSDGNVRRRLA